MCHHTDSKGKALAIMNIGFGKAIAGATPVGENWSYFICKKVMSYRRVVTEKKTTRHSFALVQ